MLKRIWIRRLVPLAALALLACSSGTAEKEKAVATVNGAPITTAELQQKAASYAKNSPITRHTVDDQLHIMIEHKLLIQEAVKTGLNEDKRFVETIKTFWEQTIIRNLIEAKTGEISGKIFVTDKEIANEYERMKFRPRIRAVRGARTKQDADAIVRQMQNGERIPGEETIGPLFYEDAKGSPLANAFDMKVGQIGAFAGDDEHVVLCIIDRESMPLPPLKELSKRIGESILVQKRQKALAEWIAAVKKTAKVQIDEKELRRIANE
ncbi:MAG: hypothetical protein ACD_75C00011G0003 [uncultured bacterium]|nr:MAG: hypothetical protein ACD_75C00011G0003 [uncultured bacterium]HBB15804.1 hypothetical protein [Syntrophus sp. (in: bacteria)]